MARAKKAVVAQISQALALLANKDGKFDITIAEKGWEGITEEQRQWSRTAYEAKYGEPMDV